MKQRAYVHLSDGQVIGVYLVPEDQATPELGETVSRLAHHYVQQVANVVPDECATGAELVALIESKNPEDDEQ